MQTSVLQDFSELTLAVLDVALKPQRMNVTMEPNHEALTYACSVMEASCRAGGTYVVRGYDTLVPVVENITNACKCQGTSEADTNKVHAVYLAFVCPTLHKTSISAEEGSSFADAAEREEAEGAASLETMLVGGGGSSSDRAATALPLLSGSQNMRRTPVPISSLFPAVAEERTAMRLRGADPHGEHAAERALRTYSLKEGSVGLTPMLRDAYGMGVNAHLSPPGSLFERLSFAAFTCVFYQEVATSGRLNAVDSGSTMLGAVGKALLCEDQWAEFCALVDVCDCVSRGLVLKARGGSMPAGSFSRLCMADSVTRVSLAAFHTTTTDPSKGGDPSWSRQLYGTFLAKCTEVGESQQTPLRGEFTSDAFKKCVSSDRDVALRAFTWCVSAAAHSTHFWASALRGYINSGFKSQLLDASRSNEYVIVRSIHRSLGSSEDDFADCSFALSGAYNVMAKLGCGARDRESKVGRVRGAVAVEGAHVSLLCTKVFGEIADAGSTTDRVKRAISKVHGGSERQSAGSSEGH